MLNFEDFEAYMKQLEYIMILDERASFALGRLSEDNVGLLNCKSYDLIIDLICELMNDLNEYINYYIYELNWGIEWEKECITDENDNDIPLGNLKDLYRALTEKEDLKNG